MSLRAFVTLVTLAIVVASASAQENSAWRSLAEMPSNRSDHTAVTVGDAIIVAGGCTGYQECPGETIGENCFCTNYTANVEAYFPANGSWSILPPMPVPRYRHSAVALDNVTMYVMGGRELNDSIIPTSTYVLSYTNGAWVWNEASEWVYATSDTVGFEMNNTVFVVGGYDVDYNTYGWIWALQPTQYGGDGLWHNDTIPPLNDPRGDACCAVVGNLVMVTAGYNAGNFCQPLTSLEIYDPATGTWAYGTSDHIGRGDAEAASNHDQFHVIGGDDSECNAIGGFPITSVEVYDVPYSNWTFETTIPFSLFRFAATSHNNTIYIMGGQTSFYVSGNDSYRNQIVGNLWTYDGTDTISTIGTATTTTTTTATTATTTAHSATVLSAVPSAVLLVILALCSCIIA